MSTIQIEGFRLSPQQKRVWLLEQAGGSHAFRSVCVLYLEGELDQVKLQAAWQEVIARNEILRTVYPSVPGMNVPVQSIAESRSVPMASVDLSDLDAAQQEFQLASFFDDARRSPFDYTDGPLLLATLINLGPHNHALLLNVSALCADRASLETLKRQLLSSLLNEDVAAEPAQYADMSEFFNDVMDSEDTAGGRAYWRQKSIAEPLQLEPVIRRAVTPADTVEFVPELFTFAIDPSTWDRIAAHSRSYGVSTRVFLLTCWQVLLWRLTGQDEFTIGVSTSGRTYEGIEDALGLFARQLPLSTHLHDGLSFAEALGQAEQASHEVERWQDYFAWPQDDVQLPFLPLCFDCANYPVLPECNELLVTHGPQYVCVDRFDISLSAIRYGEQLTTALYYNGAIYPREEIERLAERLTKLLESVALDPETKIGQLEILSERERRQVLFEFNEPNHNLGRDKCLLRDQTQADYLSARCIHQLFEEQVVRTPAADALAFEGERFTYEELNRRANQLAHYLRELGVGPEVVVGICVERSVEMVIGLLGILKAGAAYLPLDPTYPLERLSFMLEDAAVSVVLTLERLEDSLPTHWGQTIYLDSEWDEISLREVENPTHEVGTEDLAYIIYTSGSTGKPKGVQIQHQSLIISTAARLSYYQLPVGTFLLLPSFSFDSSVAVIFWTLCAGGTLVIPQEGMQRDPAHLARMIASERVTHLLALPSLYSALLTTARAGELETLRVTIVAGEACPKDLVKQHHYALPQTTLFNEYGPTEGTVWSSVYECSAETGSVVPIGKPIPNVEIYILDRNLEPVPLGVAGELYIGGDCLARGYLNRPELNREKFIPNTFFRRAGARLYRTGDRARFLPDGNIEFLGRLDQQVKLRGFRIEPGEIEVLLRAHAEVREVVVCPRATRTGDKELVAYVVPGEGSDHSLLVQALRQSAREKLPEYMVPATFVVLEQLPRTISGKIDLRALPEPDRGPQETDEDTAERTPIVGVVAGIWCEVLKVDQVGESDNFFSLGGHSLLVTQVMARVRELFGVELPLRDFFEAPVLNDLAGRIDAAMKSKHNLTSPPIEQVDRSSELPLSFAQQRLWFLEQMEPGNPFYSVPSAVRLKGDLDVAALEQTFNEIVRRHESLRTSFIPVDGNPVQVIVPSLTLTLEVVDLSGFDEDQREAEAMRRVAEDGRQPFDLTKAPLLRPVLLKLADDDHVLLFSMHHIISDVWSRGVLIRELRALYLGFSRKQSPRLPELPLQYADYAAWQRNWLRDETLESQLSYWKNHLEGAPAVLELPTDRPRPPVPSLNGGQERLVLPTTLLEAVRSFGRREGVTTFMTLLAAFNALLYRLTGRTDIVVGAPIANRDRIELEGIIGFFTNTLVLRTDLTGDPSFSDLVKRVREMALGAYTHRDLPFEALVEVLQPERDLSYPPLFQVMFVHQVRMIEDFELPGLTLRRMGVDNGSAKFDMTLFLVEGSGTLAAMLEYNSDLFDAATARRALSLFENILTAALAEPAKPVGELELLSPADRQQMVCEWNETSREFSRRPLIHLAFEEQVERTPESVAVTFGTERFTYRDLNRRANQLAHYLQANGVGPDVLVGICMERSLDAIVAMLAILKAGGVYVPLDATYPKERLSFMVADATTSLCLTQAHLKDKIADTITNLVCLDEEWERLSQERDDNPVCTVTADNLAYIVFTSGSTGRPKGIAIPHESNFNLITWVIDDQKPAPGDRTLQFASLNFDTSNVEIFTTWCTGGTLVLISEEVRHNFSSLLNLLVEGEINRLFLPFSVLQHLVEIAESEGPIPYSLREVNVAGEQLQINSQVISFFSKLEGCVLHNHYGPSECNVMTTHTLDGDCHAWPALPPVGKPIYNTQVYLLDQRLQPVPIRVSGEVYIGGVSLARGYFNRPDLTAAAFVPDPFSENPGSRLYRSGDLARYLPDGTIEFLGRVDHQVKIRGFRIETGEVEAALREHPEVQEVVVSAQGVHAEEKRLVAYVVPRKDARHDTLANDLRQHVREKLPEYMIPAAIVLLDQMPLTSDGKLNRRALPEPQPGRRDISQEFVGPRTPVEEVMAGIWSEVLGLDRVGIHDNFFHLGGHSLLATRVVSRLREAFGTPFPLRKIFEEPTVAGLAQVLQETIKENRGVQTLPIERVTRDAPLPVSFLQERTLLMAQQEGRPTFYNFEIHLQGRLDVDALARSLSEVVRRHEALRTTFATVEAQPVQVINPAAPVDLPVTDLSELSEVERETRAREIRTQQASKNFDLSTGPLLRLHLLRFDPNEHRLLLSVAHIACDHWSLALFSHEVSALYLAFSQGQPSPFAELPLQYADYAVWQRRWLDGEVMDNGLNYWKNQLQNAAVLKLPTDRPRPPIKTYQGHNLVFALPKELAEGVEILTRRERCTTFMTLLAVFKTLLYRYTGQEDIVVGTAVAGRTQTGIEKLIGNFGTPIALRTHVNGAMSFRELISRVREVALEGYAYQEVPFDKVLEALDLEHDPAYSPLIQVGFVVHSDAGVGGHANGSSDLSMRMVQVETGRSNFDLKLTLQNTPEGLAGAFGYSTALFDVSTIKRMVEHFQSLLESILAEPEKPLADLRMHD